LTLSTTACKFEAAPIEPAKTEIGGAEGRAVAQCLIEARKAREFRKPIVAAVLESLARVLPHAPGMRACIESWPGDIAGAGVIFRLNAGLHALARSGRDRDLQAICRAAEAGKLPSPQDLDRALTATLACHTADLMQWMAGPTQTNEVARVAGLVAALMELGARAPMPVELLELGASAGLNLNFPHYCCQVGSALCGDPASHVRIAPGWRGREVPAVPVALDRAVGVDLNPLDIRLDEDCERLHAYIWAGEQERDKRLNAAIALARTFPPRVDAGLASRWLARKLATPQREGYRRVVFHSMVVQYMPEVERRAVDAALALAAASACASRPLVRVGMEWSADRSAVELCVTMWDGSARSGRRTVVAHCHPYAEWFEWHGLEG